MIEPLTKEKLVKYGFEKETINRLLNEENYEYNINSGNKGFFASAIDRKIYSDDDYYAKTKTHMIFPYKEQKLIPKYYNQKQAAYLAKRSNDFNFKEAREKTKFLNSEIKWAISTIKNKEQHVLRLNNAFEIGVLTIYLEWLNEKNEILAQNKESKNETVQSIDSVLPKNEKLSQTKLSYILQLYYEKGCEPLNEPQIIELATKTHITLSTLKNRWVILRDDNYTHCFNPNKMKAFKNAYELLMQIFKDNGNLAAFNAVQADYKKLIER
jgi:hypothetical protein